MTTEMHTTGQAHASTQGRISSFLWLFLKAAIAGSSAAINNVMTCRVQTGNRHLTLQIANRKVCKHSIESVYYVHYATVHHQPLGLMVTISPLHAEVRGFESQWHTWFFFHYLRLIESSLFLIRLLTTPVANAVWVYIHPIKKNTTQTFFLCGRLSLIMVVNPSR
mgnify:CR=1 FL=1